MVRARIRKSPEMSNRQIAKLLGVSHTMVADERERTLNPPELKKFQAFKRTWEDLPDHHREEFVKEFSRDLADIQAALMEQSSTGNHKVRAVS
jgi:predicted transcriptional regulator